VSRQLCHSFHSLFNNIPRRLIDHFCQDRVVKMTTAVAAAADEEVVRKAAKSWLQPERPAVPQIQLDARGGCMHEDAAGAQNRGGGGVRALRAVGVVS
jgi:hypothetical protein